MLFPYFPSRSIWRRESAVWLARLRLKLKHLEWQRANRLVVNCQVEPQRDRLVERQAAQLGADVDRRFVARSMPRRPAELERCRDQWIVGSDRPTIEVERSNGKGVWLAEHVPRDRQSDDQEERSQRPGDVLHVQLVNSAAVYVELAIWRDGRVVAERENSYREPLLGVVDQLSHCTLSAA